MVHKRYEDKINTSCEWTILKYFWIVVQTINSISKGINLLYTILLDEAQPWKLFNTEF